MPTPKPRVPSSKPEAPPPTPAPTRQPSQRETPTIGKRAGGGLKPYRIVLPAVEGWGKTSLGAYAPEPVLIMCGNETGYDTLQATGAVPNIDASHAESWEDLLTVLTMIESLHYKTVILDAMDGAERLCHEHVCKRDYKGQWEGKGSFSAYHSGFHVAVNDWLSMLAILDRLHRGGMAIMLLSHCQIKPYRNPMGEDFDRIVSDTHHKTFSVTHRWADAVLFGTYLTVVESESGRGKGIGGTNRVLYCEHRDAFDAKNRYGMPERLAIPNDPSQIWNTIDRAIKEGARNNATRTNAGR